MTTNSIPNPTPLLGLFHTDLVHLIDRDPRTSPEEARETEDRMEAEALSLMAERAASHDLAFFFPAATRVRAEGSDIGTYRAIWKRRDGH